MTPEEALADAERRVTELQNKLDAVRLWAADNHMAWLKDKPITATDWDDLRDALGLKRIGP